MAITNIIPPSLRNPVCTLELQKVTIPAIPNTLDVPFNFVHTDDGPEIDVITIGVTEIFRDSAGPIYNIAVEGFPNPGVSPLNTEWNSVYTDPINNGHINIQNITTRAYSDFTTALNFAIGLNVLTTPLVMHDLITNKYYLFTFTQWTQGGGGGFAYTRTEVILGSPAVVICDGAIHFDDGTSMDTIPSAGADLPIARYIYLVQDASDAVRMGGIPGNAYTTFQTAYDAANTLQLALGGSNRVAIMVGNTTAATVGNLTLAANWNSNVIIVGQSQTSSVLGNIVASNLAVSITFINITLGNITLDAGSLTLSGCRYSTMAIAFLSGSGAANVSNCQNFVISGGILAQNITTGNSSGISCFNCINTNLGSIVASAVDGSAGSISVNGGINISITSVQQANSSAVGNYNMGGFFANNTTGLIIGGIFQTYTNGASTGTLSGVAIQNTCTNVIINNAVSILVGAAGAPSDVKVSNVVFNNTVFPTGGGLRILTIGNTQFPAIGSGYVETFLLKNCYVGWGVRVCSNTITPKTNLSFEIIDCEITWNIVVARQDCGLWMRNSNCSYNVYTLEKVRCDATYLGLNIANLLTTAPFMTSGNSMIFSQVQTVNLTLAIANPVGLTNTVDDVKFLTCTTRSAMLLTITQGNVNFFMENHSSSGYYSISSSGVAITKPTVIINSALNTTTAGLTIPTAASPPFVLKNSFMQYYTNAARTLNIIAYSSYIESIAVVATASVFTGTLNTSTIRRLVTENVAGLTLNVSYDQSY